MSFFKNILLLIIAIQLFVVVQIFVIKKWNLKTNFDHTYNVLTFQHVSDDVSDADFLLYSSLKMTIEKDLQRYRKNSLQTQFLTMTSCYANSSLERKIEVYAKNLLGKQYVWGATGPNKFDCSGFTQKVYRTAGINLPRVSREQAKVGTYVTYENLQRGDMVFFDTNHRKIGRVNHVGIYLGDSKFIHASSGNKKVVITNFNERRYYKNRFLWGRRIIKHLKKSKPLAFNNRVSSKKINL